MFIVETEEFVKLAVMSLLALRRWCHR